MSSKRYCSFTPPQSSAHAALCGLFLRFMCEFGEETAGFRVVICEASFKLRVGRASVAGRS